MLVAAFFGPIPLCLRPEHHVLIATSLANILAFFSCSSSLVFMLTETPSCRLIKNPAPRRSRVRIKRGHVGAVNLLAAVKARFF